jgi:hypothetical protein
MFFPALFSVAAFLTCVFVVIGNLCRRRAKFGCVLLGRLAQVAGMTTAEKQTGG